MEQQEHFQQQQLTQQQQQAPQLISHEICREHYDHIPYFDGNPSDLLPFTTTVKNVFSSICNQGVQQSLTNHSQLLYKVKARLTGSAQSLILTKTITTIQILTCFNS